jgi:hypothetical protein
MKGIPARIRRDIFSSPKMGDTTMIADTPRVPSGDLPRKATPVAISGRELWEAVAADPGLLEEGLAVVARRVPLGSFEVPMLATDADERPVLVLGPERPGEDLLPRIVDVFLAFQSLRPTLEKVAPDSWRLDDAPPRLLVLQPADGPLLENRIALLRGIPARVLRYRGIAIGDRRGLWVEASEAPSFPSPPRPSLGRRRSEVADRLVDDARERILGLSPEVRAVEDRDGLRFHLGDCEIARVRRRCDGITVQASPEGPEHPVLGRTDLDAALHGVIERFFEAFASGHRPDPSEAEGGKERPARGDAAAFGPLPSQAGGILDPSDLPFSGIESAPLTHEEIEEFLRSEGEGEA